jgi:hypothetical protein
MTAGGRLNFAKTGAASADQVQFLKSTNFSFSCDHHDEIDNVTVTTRTALNLTWNNNTIRRRIQRWLVASERR